MKSFNFCLHDDHVAEIWSDIFDVDCRYFCGGKVALALVDGELLKDLKTAETGSHPNNIFDRILGDSQVKLLARCFFLMIYTKL